MACSSRVLVLVSSSKAWFKKSIAISACLLGHKVRYDGAHQENKIIIQRLADRFNIIAVCPEVEIGLDVPRDKIELHQQGTKYIY